MLKYSRVTLSPSVQKTTSKLEEEIYEALAADSHVIERPDHFLTEAEEKSLEQLNADEVIGRVKSSFLILISFRISVMSDRFFIIECEVKVHVNFT